MNSLLNDPRLDKIYTYKVKYLGETYHISDKELTEIDHDATIEHQYENSHHFLTLISCLREHYENLLEEADKRYKRLYNHTYLFLHGSSKAEVLQYSGNCFESNTQPEILAKSLKTSPTDAQVKMSIPYKKWNLPIDTEYYFEETESLQELETKLDYIRKTLRRLTSTHTLLEHKENRLRTLTANKRGKAHLYS